MGQRAYFQWGDRCLTAQHKVRFTPNYRKERGGEGRKFCSGMLFLEWGWLIKGGRRYGAL